MTSHGICSQFLRFYDLFFALSTVSNTPYAMFQASEQTHNEIQYENSISIYLPRKIKPYYPYKPQA